MVDFGCSISLLLCPNQAIVNPLIRDCGYSRKLTTQPSDNKITGVLLPEDLGISWINI